MMFDVNFFIGLAIGVLSMGVILSFIKKQAFQSGKFTDQKLSQLLGEERAERLEKVLTETLREFLLGMADDNLKESEKQTIKEHDKNAS